MTDYTELNLESVLKAYDERRIVPALVGDVSENGHQVFVFGVPAYLPTSQEAGVLVEEGKEVDVCVIKIMPETNNVVVSARVAGEVKAIKEAQELNIGDVVRVRVKNIVDYGAFVTTESGVDGLIVLKELSYTSIHSAEEVVSIGDVIEAKVVKISEKRDRTRVGFSYKKTLPDPWESVNLEVGQMVEGTVSNILDYGAFLIVGSITGLLPRTELSWSGKPPKPAEVFTIGQKVEAKIIFVDKEKKKLVLSIREIAGDPWIKLVLKEGDIVEGKISNKAKYGVFIGVTEGVEGLLHVSDMAWLKVEANALLDSLQVGDSIKVLAETIDKGKKRISFSIKAMQPHPYDAFVSEHHVGTSTEAIIQKNASLGKMSVALPIGVFTIMFPQSYKDRWSEVMEEFPVGSIIPVTVNSYDPETKKLVLNPVV